MSKCHYETYRYTRELCRVENQSIVECRFPGAEIVSVLAVQARVIESECTCADGEVKYNGKLWLGLVYEDGSGSICRAERGAEFFHKAACADVSPACLAKGAFSTQNITHRKDGASTYVTVLLNAEIQVYTQAEIGYLTGGDGVIVKQEKLPVVGVYTAKGETEETDEFDVDGVTDILMHEESVQLLSCTMRSGEIELVGEICYDVCALQEKGGIVRYERILPLKIALPCEEGSEEDGVKGALEIRRAEVSLNVNEEDGRAKISFLCVVNADCVGYQTALVSMGTDAFSPVQKLSLKRQKVAGRYASFQKTETRRVAGTASVSFAEEGWSLVCAFLPSVEISQSGEVLEGVLEAQALLKNADGSYRVSTLSLPFALDIRTDGEEEIACTVTGLSVRGFGKETQMEGTLKVTMTGYGQMETEFVSQAELGEAIAKKESSITIFLPRKGEELWEVAKKMGVAPEEVEKCNPTVHFPVEEDERIVVYRQKG